MTIPAKPTKAARSGLLFSSRATTVPVGGTARAARTTREGNMRAPDAPPADPDAVPASVRHTARC
ncbi:hypothetical protein OH782_41080 [Streptomyces sp. NBC_01544]|uniref:hypothetical protein n=1 Tax=unclassified Streptomyces TaxID=2593676 RepID=UPI0028C46073|nr:hypothetical protein [Streptomyces sp. AM2-3-1]WNO62461.1 hypothetical protein RPQ02_00900 [Streptomyces sp. AM2-3-1]WTE57426.1 hypothetical protein OG784_00735 [Streptomyces sp. NBC_01617]WTI84936.1 hypothetical protein OHB17_01075 [Streptomyces sp. NBC_00724]